MNCIVTTKPSCLITPTDITSYLCSDFLQEDVTELDRKQIITLDENQISNQSVKFQYQLENDISGHLLTGFSAKISNQTQTRKNSLKKTKKSRESIVPIPSIWDATLYIGPRIISTVQVELSNKRKCIPFFKNDNPLMLPLFLLQKWPIKIQFQQICGSTKIHNGHSINPRVFINTKWLTPSIQERILNKCDIEITYWPTHSIAIHQIRLLRI